MANVIRKREEKTPELPSENISSITPEQRAELLKTESEKEAEHTSSSIEEITINGQTYQLASKQPEQPRSKRLDGSKKIWVADDVDPTKEKRKRNKHGTAINFPLYVEEFIAIEAVYEDALKSGDTDSFADYVREVLKTHAKSKLGKERYDAILAEKINQVMDK